MYKEKCKLDDSPGDPDDCDRDKALIYRLMPDSKVEIAQGIFEQTYGSKLVQQKELLPEKAIILVGATGNGKSTFMNRMINHIFGVKCHDEFRFQIVVEGESSQTESQTTDITKYVVYKSHLLFKLIIIDTPGFGSTAGKQEDRMTVEKIKNLFKSSTVVSIDAICFVVKYNNQRLTDYWSYVFTSIAHMFGIDVKENIYIMATFCDSAYDIKRYIKPAPTLKCIKKAGIPFKSSFPFSNNDIYFKPEHQIDCSHWETSEISFELFFEELDKTLAVSLKLSRDILERKHIILHAQLPDFVRKLKNSIHIIHEHKQNLKAIEEDLKNPNEKLFTFRVTVEREIMQDIEEPNIFCTKCEKCNRICHYPCDIKNDFNLWWCDTISWFNLDFYFYCTVCPDKCSWKCHKRCQQRPVHQTTTEVRTSEYLKRRYLQVKGHEKDSLMKLCEENIVSAYGDLLKDLEGIQECINFINTQCLCDVGTTLEEYINDIIENEGKVREDGYLTRITVLEYLVATMRKLDIFKAFERGSKEDRLHQAKQCYKNITD